jgi:hypothetical protein
VKKIHLLSFLILLSGLKQAWIRAKRKLKLNLNLLSYILCFIYTIFAPKVTLISSSLIPSDHVNLIGGTEVDPVIISVLVSEPDIVVLVRTRKVISFRSSGINTKLGG